MGQILNGSATTTEAVRRAIQNSQESLNDSTCFHTSWKQAPKCVSTLVRWSARIHISEIKNDGY